MGRSFEHHPVLAHEVVGLLGAAGGGVVVDATVGGGGHAGLLLSALDPRTRLLGLDRDPAALEAAAAALAPFGDRVTLRHRNFRDIADALKEEGLVSVQGILVDLGVSSPQLDWPERGFSYRHDAPLDMRMDPDTSLTAAQVIAEYDTEALAKVLARFGEERFARRIAAAIVTARTRAPLRTTGELARVVTEAIPAPARRRGPHPARRTFQALRIEVNDELGALAGVLADGPSLLGAGGTMVVISYHSLEDRMVKRAFGALTRPPRRPRGLPVTGGEPETPFVAATRGAVTPPADEVSRNPRAEAAKLRAIRRRAA